MQSYTMDTKILITNGVKPATKTINIHPSSLQPAKLANDQQQIIVIPHSMLVNGYMSGNDLKIIIDDSKLSIKTMENRTNLKRPSSSGDSTYGTDSDEGSSIHEGSESVRKRANLDHLSPKEKLMRRRLKNRITAQNARDKNRLKMEDMKTEFERLRAHTKALEVRNAQLVSENERLAAKNDQLFEAIVTKRKPEEPSMANVENRILKTEDFDYGNQQDANACEEIFDHFLEFTSEMDELSSSSNSSYHDNTILDIAWEETFGDLFPDLGECML